MEGNAKIYVASRVLPSFGAGSEKIEPVDSVAATEGFGFFSYLLQVHGGRLEGSNSSGNSNPCKNGRGKVGQTFQSALCLSRGTTCRAEWGGAGWKACSTGWARMSRQESLFHGVGRNEQAGKPAPQEGRCYALGWNCWWMDFRRSGLTWV